MKPSSVAPPAVAAAVVAAAALLLSHGSGTSGAAPVARAGHIEILNFAYAPTPVTAQVGSTVVFTNDESVEHTATSDSEGVFDTGTLTKGQSVSIVLNKVGTFSYHCSFHAFMHGTLKVIAR